MRLNQFNHIIPFLFILIGSYVASYFFFFFPATLSPGSLSIVILLVALPCLFFLYRWVGWKSTLLIVLTLGGLVLLIESIGALTGFPYGVFYYTDLVGFKVFGLVPWAVPFAFLPLLLGAITLSIHYIKTPWKLILVTALLLVVIDLIIDPILVHLGVWVWVPPGVYYGVPISNFVGWFITGVITVSIFFVLIKNRFNLKPRLPLFIALSLVLTLAFWSGYALWSMLYVPFVLSLCLLGPFFFTFVKYWPVN
ncbi:MAG: carotenoid biosynthesis protein [Candidatus Thorarchaeota archaeon]